MIKNMHLFRNPELDSYELTVRNEDNRLYSVLIPGLTTLTTEDLPNVLYTAGRQIQEVIDERASHASQE